MFCAFGSHIHPCPSGADRGGKTQALEEGRGITRPAQPRIYPGAEGWGYPSSRRTLYACVASGAEPLSGFFLLAKGIVTGWPEQAPCCAGPVRVRRIEPALACMARQICSAANVWLFLETCYRFTSSPSPLAPELCRPFVMAVARLPPALGKS